MDKGYLILSDKTYYPGYIFGYGNLVFGEVVFNTSMVGYIESLTDPSYKNQILILTYPLVGNYGMPYPNKDQNALDSAYESDNIQLKGIVVREYVDHYSHWNAESSLSTWMEKNKLIGL